MAITTKLEVKWDGVSWTDETSYLLGYEAHIGFKTDDPTFLKALVGEVGRLTCWVNNRSRRFSQGLTDEELGGTSKAGAGAAIRLTLVATVVFNGYVSSIDVRGGRYGPQTATIYARDFMYLLEHVPVSVEYSQSKDVTTALNEIVGQAGTFTKDFNDIGDTVGNYGKFWRYPGTSCRDAIEDICATVRGRFCVLGDGTLAFRTRDDLQLVNVASSFTLGSDVVAMGVGEKETEAITRVSVEIIPPDETGSSITLFQARSVMRVAAGTTRDFNLRFRDPSTGRYIASRGVTTMAAGSDYVINSKADGSGADYTESASVTVAQNKKADRMLLSVQNNLVDDIYFTTLKVRGLPLYTYDAVVLQKENSGSSFREHSVEFGMPLGGDEDFALNFIDLVLGRWADPEWGVNWVEVNPRSPLGVSPVTVELLDLVTLSDSQTISGSVKHRVWAISYSHYPDTRRDRVRFFVGAVDDVNYAICDDLVYGLADQNRAGF